jgi:outer membrane murein-binding lipoprotein Lpp
MVASFGAAVAFVTLLGGCASPPAPEQAAAKVDDDQRQVCTREVPVGTLMPVTRCRTVAQIRKDEEEARKNLGFTRQSAGEAAADRIGR